MVQHREAEEQPLRLEVLDPFGADEAMQRYSRRLTPGADQYVTDEADDGRGVGLEEDDEDLYTVAGDGAVARERTRRDDSASLAAVQEGDGDEAKEDAGAATGAADSGSSSD